mmetsp:Transcript_20085/g.55472  ORF Transcript_20085/g.55472 Transcript_20085/m.55472 type:complete len:560 (+) Transcript_20085:156-1835(+)
MSRKEIATLPLLCTIVIVGSILWHAAWAPFALHQNPTTRLALEKPIRNNNNNNKNIRETSSSSNRPVRRLEQEAHKVEVYVQYDNYADDIEWSLKDDGRHQTLANYKANQTDNGKERTTTVNVTNGRFVFEVKDKHGDGLCCRSRDYRGHYRLSVNGNLIAQGGEFADTTGPIKFETSNDGKVSSSQKAHLGLQPHCLAEEDDDPHKFSICLYLTTSAKKFGNAWLPAFAAAKKRWESIVVRNSNEPVEFRQTLWQRPKSLGGIYITGEAAPIDGPGGILGSSGPRAIVTTSKKNPVNHNHNFKQTLTGQMTFDSADIDVMLKDHNYKDVIVHEMGHVLGIGTMWEYNGLHSGRPDDPVYNGVHAQREYKKIGFPGKLEVEIDHGEGTAGGHWDEECLRSELMTGIADPKMQLSSVTVGGMEDLGFDVDYKAADPFEVPAKSQCGQLIPAQVQDTQVRMLRGPSPQRRLSPKARERAISYAELEMQKCRDQYNMTNLPEGAEFVGDKLRHVLVEEEGNVYSVTVRKKKGSQRSIVASNGDERDSSLISNGRPIKVSGLF